MKQNVPFGEAHSRQSEPPEQKKQSNYRKNRVFPYITLFPLEKNIESKNTDNKT